MSASLCMPTGAFMPSHSASFVPHPACLTAGILSDVDAVTKVLCDPDSPATALVCSQVPCGVVVAAGVCSGGAMPQCHHCALPR